MRRMRLGFYLIWPLLWPAPGAAEHNALLPRPQQVRYGSHQFPARGLSIHFASAPTAEDRFSAQNLSSCLSDRMGAPVPVAKDSASELALVLRRTGTGPDLPIPEERPGSESREAYSLSVTPQGGEVRASSSAGLFYGVQTLCQMIEGQGADAALPEVEIRDWPSLAYRGIMVDMSHGPLPTEEEVKLQIDFLARWKANQYYFYSEASIELEGYPLLNPQHRCLRPRASRRCSALPGIVWAPPRRFPGRAVCGPGRGAARK